MAHKLLSEKGRKDGLQETAKALELAEVEVASLLSTYQPLMCDLGAVAVLCRASVSSSVKSALTIPTTNGSCWSISD